MYMYVDWLMDGGGGGGGKRFTCPLGDYLILFTALKAFIKACASPQVMIINFHSTCQLISPGSKCLPPPPPPKDFVVLFAADVYEGIFLLLV